MRMGLALHHWTTIVLALWGILMAYCTHYNSKVLRCFFTLSLYMSTEQNVFIEMLMYHWPLNWHVCYSISAWYYLLSRIAIMGASIWTWWDCKDAIWDHAVQKPFLVYGLWLFVPSANLILNATQLTTVQSLFGIAKAVRLRVKETSTAKNALSYVFQNIDFNGNGKICSDEWEQYCLSMEQMKQQGQRSGVIVYPRELFTQIFTEMDVVADGDIDFEEFYAYWNKRVMLMVQQEPTGEWVPEERKGIVRFDLTCEAVVAKTMLEREGGAAVDGWLRNALTTTHSMMLMEMDEKAVHDARYETALQHLELKARVKDQQDWEQATIEGQATTEPKSDLSEPKLEENPLHAEETLTI
eukprot:TRINITY_DN16601_c0_g1_i3.p2 TRINITY_DN16601_c0_g1~~TRINITY_DN16601_c0_g1_i3.p2  ORF type:complete len:355 (-),score=88.03 TRINITY_DN16601_c0_g1_i3:453-1517(-)